MTAYAKDTLILGIDIGSTTIKAVVRSLHSETVLWKDYIRHDTKQAEKLAEFLARFEREIPGYAEAEKRVFMTGSGGTLLSAAIGAKFVQEVHAVSLAVEKLYPACMSVVELGGQDAKIIVFQEDKERGTKRKIPSMNDKCAGGTGATIDKINAKVKLSQAELAGMGYDGIRIHPVAGKCGVFAETDITNLQKVGTPPHELMASLFDAIVLQNLSVLTRGNTLLPQVLLLGGPNTYIKGLQECWRHHIPKLWAERKIALPEGVDPKSLIVVPENAEYFAALGVIEFGLEEDPKTLPAFKGVAGMKDYLTSSQRKEDLASRKGATKGLVENEDALARFREEYAIPSFKNAVFPPGTVIEGFLGLDGGSTSTKAVLLSKEEGHRVLFKTYRLSMGNPIEDAQTILLDLEKQALEMGCTLEILGVATTGYAKDVLKDVIAADAAIVETVAHTQAGMHMYDDVDVICDVGGQDIKIIMLKDGRVKDFRLNTQCSAGNGYFLQSTAESFRVPVESFADQAFGAEYCPEFGFGCAVFMQSDIVDFQRKGWAPAEILAGLCQVLPKNIWLYVSQIPNLAALGTRFLLQGGTQRNLAAVKAQVDFIRSRFKDKGVEPDVIVHEHCGEAGAIGCALEAARLYGRGKRTKFIGFDGLRELTFQTNRDERTRCYFCKNKCLRTFIDVKVPEKVAAKKAAEENDGSVDASYRDKEFVSKVPLPDAHARVIVATCEKGTVEDVDQMKVIKKGVEGVKGKNPNFLDVAAREAFRPVAVESVGEPAPRRALDFLKGAKAKERATVAARRKDLRIGIPRVLNMYSTAPFFMAYFQSLGIDPEKIRFSDYTSVELYKEGSKRGSIDPCFPSKLGNAHVHNLLFKLHPKLPLDWIFFPMIDSLPSALHGVQSNRACPTITATPEAVKAAFTKERDLFLEAGVRYFAPVVALADRGLTKRQLFACFEGPLGLTEKENVRAVEAGYAALAAYERDALQKPARETLDMLEREGRTGIVVLGRPYHNDPGVNHEILEELQKRGYPIFTQDSLPLDADILERLFGDEIREGEIPSPFNIGDVWKNSYSENTSKKVWAAKYTARHPNLVAVEISNFKCGHDAPIYNVVESIIECSGTPYFCFKDLDENKPQGSIKIRIETIDYFLRRYEQETLKKDLYAAEGAAPGGPPPRPLPEVRRAPAVTI